MYTINTTPSKPSDYQRPRPEVYKVFAALEVGQSFDVPKNQHQRIRKSAERYCDENEGVTLVMRKISADTYRVWRTA